MPVMVVSEVVKKEDSVMSVGVAVWQQLEGFVFCDSMNGGLCFFCTQHSFSAACSVEAITALGDETRPLILSHCTRLMFFFFYYCLSVLW